MRPRRRLNEAEQRDLMTRQAALTALTKHPSWGDFENEVGLKVDRVERNVLAQTLRTREPINELDIVYWRGFIHGLRWLVAAPAGAEARLDSFLRQQQSEEDAA